MDKAEFLKYLDNSFGINSKSPAECVNDVFILLKEYEGKTNSKEYEKCLEEIKKDHEKNGYTGIFQQEQLMRIDYMLKFDFVGLKKMIARDAACGLSRYFGEFPLPPDNSEKTAVKRGKIIEQYSSELKKAITLLEEFEKENGFDADIEEKLIASEEALSNCQKMHESILKNVRLLG